MINKEGQLTIFIIIVILIVAGIVLFFVLRGGIQKEQLITPEIAPIKTFVDECIYDTGENALYFAGLHGGYYMPSKFSTSLGIPYYIKDNETLMPAKEKIELEISKYVDESLPLCTGNFTEFEEFKITRGEIKTQTIILDDEVILNVEYPLTIIKGEQKSRIKKFEAKILIRLGMIYNASNFIVSEHIQNASEICMSCILNLQEKNKLSIMTQDEENTIIYNIFSNDYLFSAKKDVEPERYNFRFAIELK